MLVHLGVEEVTRCNYAAWLPGLWWYRFSDADRYRGADGIKFRRLRPTV